MNTPLGKNGLLVFFKKGIGLIQYHPNDIFMPVAKVLV